MDTSETYIKMRLASLPDLGNGSEPDCACGYEYLEGNKVGIDGKGDWYIMDDDGSHICQLERQDQLQEMVGLSKYEPPDFISLMADFSRWYLSQLDDNWKYIRDFDSGECVWLVFIMKEKYGKTWNGSEWG